MIGRNLYVAIRIAGHDDFPRCEWQRIPIDPQPANRQLAATPRTHQGLDPPPHQLGILSDNRQIGEIIHLQNRDIGRFIKIVAAGRENNHGLLKGTGCFQCLPNRGSVVNPVAGHRSIFCDQKNLGSFVSAVRHGPRLTAPQHYNGTDGKTHGQHQQERPHRLLLEQRPNVPQTVTGSFGRRPAMNKFVATHGPGSAARREFK